MAVLTTVVRAREALVEGRTVTGPGGGALQELPGALRASREERPLDRILGLPQSLGGRVDEVRGPAQETRDDQPRRNREEQQEQHHTDQGGQHIGCASAAHPVRQRSHQGGREECEHERRDHHLQPTDDETDRDDEPEDAQHRPRPPALLEQPVLPRHGFQSGTLPPPSRGRWRSRGGLTAGPLPGLLRDEKPRPVCDVAGEAGFSLGRADRI